MSIFDVKCFQVYITVEYCDISSMNNKCFDSSADKRVGDQHIYNIVFIQALKSTY